MLALEYLYTVLVLVENDKRATWKDDVNVRMKSRTCAVRAAETTDVPGVDKFSSRMCLLLSSLLRKKSVYFSISVRSGASGVSGATSIPG